ncbi:MAG: DUF3267 domain-containing protein [Chloroflexi bacterium]|nr:DUF3267 domain-containing protein [Chloroflexota bacterium]
MSELNPRTVHELPADYHEAAFLHLTSAKNVVWLNILSFVPLVISGAFFWGWMIFYYGVLGAPLASNWPRGGISIIIGLFLMLGMIVLHELFHGLAINFYGHKARYGMKLHKGVVYATADGSLFWRNQYIGVCLAPLIGITVLVLLGSLFVSETLGLWLMLIGAMNAAGAIGDIWMVKFATRYPNDALIRDEADGMRIFTPSLQA